MKRIVLSFLTCLFLPAFLQADVGDPQLRTDHPWYPGELACSTFERLFATQAEQYQRVVGKTPTTDEEKALAAWMWRNTHYFHAEEGVENLWGQGFGKGSDFRTRDYWTGLFSHGFGLCGTTHSQWVAEMEQLLGHGRGRGVGVEGHNSFEVFLTGGNYGQGKWVLLDHDISTVVYDKAGKTLLSIPEIKKDVKQWTSRKFMPDRQPWLVCGLHPSDGGVFNRYSVAEYFAGYTGAPPMVHLRKGESLRRYFEPGLEDGKTFVFWGRNYNMGGIPGPERALTWVNQPEKMYRSKSGPTSNKGQARYGNAVFVYTPDFTTNDYKEGVLEEDNGKVVFEFTSPFIIGTTPPNDKPWGIYDDGGKNGLVLRGKAACAVSVSTDRGQTWKECGPFQDGMDLTDPVKGYRQYWLRLHAGAKDLRDSGLSMTTVCQLNAAILPRLKDGGSIVNFETSRKAVVSAGPNLPQAQAHVIAGKFDSPKVSLEIATPRQEPVLAIHAAAHIRSSNPPRPEIKYQIEYSLDQGKTWKPIVKDWSVIRRGEEPKDFWSQSCCWGSIPVKEKDASKVQVRFHNNGGKQYARAEVHLVYQAKGAEQTKVTYSWTDSAGPHQESHVFGSDPWAVPTGRNTKTQWVQMEPSSDRK